MESILLILSGAILAAGVLYWLWSHIQLTQKKVQLLENAVFELRGMLTNGSVPSVAPAQELKEDDLQYGESEGQYGGESQPKYNDLPDDEWDTPVRSTSLEELQESDDLQPGGHALAPSLEVKEIQSESEFRELFVQPAASPVKASTEVKEVSGESLEGMPVKELRRLAEQRGLTGVSDLKKKELISALRQMVGSHTEVEQDLGRTLDLTETDLQDATLLEENL